MAVHPHFMTRSTACDLVMAAQGCLPNDLWHLLAIHEPKDDAVSSAASRLQQVAHIGSRAARLTSHDENVPLQC